MAARDEERGEKEVQQRMEVAPFLVVAHRLLTLGLDFILFQATLSPERDVFSATGNIIQVAVKRANEAS